MSSLPNEMPAWQAWRKPSAIIRSQKMHRLLLAAMAIDLIDELLISCLVSSRLISANGMSGCAADLGDSIMRPGVVSTALMIGLPSSSTVW